MGSASSSVATFSLSNLSYIKSGKRKNNEKEIISSILAPSSFSRKISPNNQTTNNKSGSSKYKIQTETNQHLNNEDSGDTQTNVQRKHSSKRQQSSKKDVLGYENEDTKENSKLNSLDEYNSHVLPLIIGDTVHILEENGEGKFYILLLFKIKYFHFFYFVSFILHNLYCYMF